MVTRSRSNMTMKIFTSFLLVSLCLLPSFSINADEIVPGDNLVIDGIPKIPLSLAQEVGRYSEFRRARFLDWHPIRKEMLINTRLGNTYQLHHLRFPGGARTQLLFTTTMSSSVAISQPTLVISFSAEMWAAMNNIKTTVTISTLVQRL